MVNRNSQRAQEIPPSLKAGRKVIPWYAIQLSPVGKWARHAIHGKKARYTRITHLLALCSPSAIARLVVAIVVDAIKRHAFGRMAHVGQKVLETCPSFADGNATASIMPVAHFISLAAASAHAKPSTVNTTPVLAVTVREVGGNKKFAIKTSARSRYAEHQSASGDHSFRSAHAHTSPKRVVLVARAEFENAQTAERHTGQVFHIGASFSHSGILP